jgi:hypothetical protein
MAATYDNNVQIDFDLGENWRGRVFDWLECDNGKRVRVQASRRVVVSRWDIDWNNRNRVIEEFNRRKEEHKAAVEKAAGRVYEIE